MNVSAISGKECPSLLVILVYAVAIIAHGKFSPTVVLITFVGNKQIEATKYWSVSFIII